MADDLILSELDGLTHMQKHFVLSYLNPDSDVFLNATGAAAAAGYSYPNQQAFEVLRTPRVSKIIDEYFAQLSMSSDEVIYRLSRMAAANPGDFMKLNEDSGELEINFEMVLQKGWLVKSCYQNAKGHWRLELHDPVRCLEMIGKARNLFSERIDMNVHQQNNDLNEALERSFRLVYGDPEDVIEVDPKLLDIDNKG